MTPAFPFVSIIIPTFNRAKLLGATLSSFLLQDYPSNKYEIIVSDNNSSDNTRRVIEGYQKNIIHVRYHYEPEQGVHYARNSAAKISRGDILYFTDDDMIAERSLLSEMVKAFRFDEAVGCATGKVLPKYERNPPKWVARTMVNSLLSLTPLDKAEEIQVTRACIAYSCHQAIKREVFFQAGGFNPENTRGRWLGNGETGLNIKMSSKGVLFAYTSKSVIYHLIPPERMTLRYLIKRLSNQANCDSCTAYRFHRKRSGILAGIVRRNTLGAARLTAETMMKIALGVESWHFIPARCVYFFKRTLYDLKVFFNTDFRKFIERDNWIDYGEARIE